MQSSDRSGRWGRTDDRGWCDGVQLSSSSQLSCLVASLFCISVAGGLMDLVRLGQSSTILLLPELYSSSSCSCSCWCPLPCDCTGVTVQAEHYLTLSCTATGWNIPNIIWGCRLLVYSSSSTGSIIAWWEFWQPAGEEGSSSSKVFNISLSFAQNPLICSAALCKIPISLSFEAGRSSSIFSPLCSAHHRACQLAMIVSMGKFHKSCMTMKRRGVGRADAKMVFGKKQCKWWWWDIPMALKSLICKKKVDGGHATASWIVCLFLRFKTPPANPAWLWDLKRDQGHYRQS